MSTKKASNFYICVSVCVCVLSSECSLFKLAFCHNSFFSFFKQLNLSLSFSRSSFDKLFESIVDFEIFLYFLNRLLHIQKEFRT